MILQVKRLKNCAIDSNTKGMAMPNLEQIQHWVFLRTVSTEGFIGPNVLFVYIISVTDSDAKQFCLGGRSRNGMASSSLSVYKFKTIHSNKYFLLYLFIETNSPVKTDCLENTRICQVTSINS